MKGTGGIHQKIRISFGGQQQGIVFNLLCIFRLRMIGRSKQLAVRKYEYHTKNNYINITQETKISTLTRCGYTIVERIVMSKRTALEPLSRTPEKPNTSTDFVYYQPASHPKIKKISATRVGKRPVYRFVIDYDGKYFPLRCMLDLGSTSFVISPEAARAFLIPVVSRPKPAKAGDVSGSQLTTEGLFTVPLGVSFGNHRSFDDNDHAFEVIKTAADYDALIPAWYLEKHKARAITTSHLHFPHCPQTC